MRGPDRLLCDHTNKREGRGWGKPCPRRVVIETTLKIGGLVDGNVYSMHFCERHRGNAENRPDCAQEVSRREIER